MKHFAILAIMSTCLSAADLPKDLLGSYDLTRTDFELNGKMLNMETKGLTGSLVIEAQSLKFVMNISGRTDEQVLAVTEWKTEEAGVVRFVNEHNRVVLLIKTPKGCVVKQSKTPDGKSTGEMEVMEYAKRQ